MVYSLGTHYRMHVAVVEKSGKRFPAVYVCIGFVVFALVVVILGYLAGNRRYVVLPLNPDTIDGEQLGEPSVDSGETQMAPSVHDKVEYTQVKSDSLDSNWLKSLLLPDNSRKPTTTEDKNWVLNEITPVHNSSEITNSSQFTNSNGITNSSLIDLETSKPTENISDAKSEQIMGTADETKQTAPYTRAPLGTVTTGKGTPGCLEYSTYHSVKDFVSHQIQSLGDSEENNLQDFQRALSTDPRLGVIDVGAFMGLYSLVAVEMGRSALVVEPNHACALQIQRMLQNTNMMPSVSFLEDGISDKNGYGRLSSDAKRLTLVEVPDEEVTIERLSNHELFKVITLNQLSFHVNFETAILRIDIMSSQPTVFQEAQILFDTIHIPFIFMDWEYSSDRDEVANRTIHFLKSNNFRPKQRLQNGFGLSTAFYQFWPKRVIWAKKYQWDN